MSLLSLLANILFSVYGNRLSPRAMIILTDPLYHPLMMLIMDEYEIIGYRKHSEEGYLSVTYLSHTPHRLPWN
jgi:hypothetical protein